MANQCELFEELNDDLSGAVRLPAGMLDGSLLPAIFVHDFIMGFHGSAGLR